MRIKSMVVALQFLYLSMDPADCGTGDWLDCAPTSPPNISIDGGFQFTASDLNINRGDSAKTSVLAFDMKGKPISSSRYTYTTVNNTPGVTVDARYSFNPDTVVMNLSVSPDVPTNATISVDFQAKRFDGIHTGTLVPWGHIIVHVKKGATADFLFNPVPDLLLSPGTPDSEKITLQLFAGTPPLAPVQFSVDPPAPFLTATFSPNPASGTETTIRAEAGMGLSVGRHAYVVTGKSGGLTRSIPFAIIISREWRSVLSGSTSTLNGVAMIDDYTGVAVGGNGTTNAATILRTTDGGRSWSAPAVTFGPGGNNAVSFNSRGVGLVASDQGAVYWSTDYGASWVNRPLPLNRNMFGALMNTVNDSSAIVVGAAGTVFWTANAGITWNQGTSNTTADLYCVVASSSSGGTKIAVGGSGTLLRTATNGSSWTASTIAGAGTLRSVFAVNSSTATAVGDGGAIWHSQDLTQWTTQGSHVTNDLHCITFARAAFIIDQNIGYIVGTGGTMLGTVDGGIHWSRVTTPTSADLNSMSKMTALSIASMAKGVAVGGGGIILNE